jgi:hypothetical protein
VARPSRCPRCGSGLASIKGFRDYPGAPTSWLVECPGLCDATMTIEDDAKPATFRRQVL